MRSSRFLSSILSLPFRSLHVTTFKRQPHLTAADHTQSNVQDFEYQLLQCLSQRNLQHARNLLNEMPHQNSIIRCTSLLSRFARDGFVYEARALFDLMPHRNVVTYNAMLSAYVHSGKITAAHQMFDHMPHRNVVSWTSMLCGLARAGRIGEARELFEAMPERNVVSWNSMIAGLIRNGDLDGARKLFDEMPERSTVSWNAMIAGYVERSMMEEARQLFEEMGGSTNVVSWTTVISGYCRVGNVAEAYDLFRTMVIAKNVVCWTAMIGGFAWNGWYDDALLLFLEMKQTADVKPNGETLLSLIYACSGLGFYHLGKQVHGSLLVHGMDGGDCDGRLSKGLIHMYSRFGIMPWAHHIFDQNITKCDTVCWNSMINGYVQIGRLQEAQALFDTMTVDQDGITWTTMIAACFDSSDVQEARDLFDRMPIRDNVAWTAMISGHVQNELISDALSLFSEMRVAGFPPLDHTFASLFGAVGSISHLEIGEQLHGLLTKSRSESDVILTNSLISMYAKCGDVHVARRIFSGMTSRDVVSWNSMIVGLSNHGRAHESLRLFEAMRGDGMMPNSVTFLGALTACSHVGLVNLGQEIFESMGRTGSVEPGVEHYVSIVDLLGRAGRWEEAERFVMEMPVEPGVEVWGALLGTCGMECGDGGVARDVGIRAARRLLELDPVNAPGHVALCHVYVGGGEYEEEGVVRREMGWKGVRKVPGCSWIGVKGRVHVFLCGDRSHPQTDEIYSLLVGDGWREIYR